MEVIEFIENFNKTLEQSFLFRSLKFVLGFYLIIMATAIALMVWRLVRFDYFVILQAGEEVARTKGKMSKRWDETRARLESDDPNEWKAAVLEAAGMLNEVLGIVGYEGATLGEKLENLLPNQLDNLDEAKEANKIKNQIVQDEQFQMTREEAQQTADVFAESLRFFEAIG